MDTGQQSAATYRCPGCGQSIDAYAVYCPTCGRPNKAITGPAHAQPSDATHESAYATAPALATDATVPPPLPAWIDQSTTTSGTTSGIAGLAAGPAIAPSQPIRSHKRRNILTAVSALVIVALIGSGAYLAYAALASRNSNQLAHYYPASTVVFASADLEAAAKNNFKINPADLAGGAASTLQKATGLDWQKDVMPWVGRDIAVGVFPTASGEQIATNPGASIGVVALVQSRDDNAAKAAIGKLNSHLKQQGTSTEQSSYKGFTLYASNGDSPAGNGMYGSGSGWVLIGSNAAAAHAVIDRINGSGDTLSDQQAFKDATGNAPANQFGSYYINIKQLLDEVTPKTAPNGLGGISVPFIQTYPVAGGYVGWTDTGERSQITFNAVRNPNIPNVSGDTTGFAALVPSDAMAYAGVGNLGRLAQAAVTQIGITGANVDPLPGALGVSASDPLAQQAAGIAALKSSKGNAPVQPVIYIHVNDNAAASQLVSKIAAAHSWTAQPTTIAGQSATALYESSPADIPTDVTGNTGPGPVTVTAHLAGVALTLNNTLVIAPDTNAATLIAQVAQGSAPNLASNATFQKMIQAAPSGAAITGYVNSTAFQPLLNAGGASAETIFSHFDVLALTIVWNDSMLQGTLDAGLHG
jgi:Protein of unknown function (DUF3352)